MVNLMTDDYYIMFRGDHPGTRYWDGDDWVPNIRDAAHYAPDNLPDTIPSVRGLYDLDRCKYLVVRVPGNYEPPESYQKALEESLNDQDEWLDDEYRESYYVCLPVADIAGRGPVIWYR